MRGGPVRRARSLLAGAFAVAVLLGVAAPAGAASPAQLHRAKAQLAALGVQIKAEERILARIDGRLRPLNDQIDQASERLVELQQQARVVRQEVADLRERLQALQTQMAQLASSAYVGQPGGQLGTVLSVVLGSQSFSELSDGFEYAARLSDQADALAGQITATEARLTIRLDSLEHLVSQESDLMTALSGERARVGLLDAEHRAALDRLNATRDQMIQIVRGLERKLAARLFPMVGTAFQGGAHTSYGRWSVLFLRVLKAPVCRSNEVVLVAWQLAEFTQAAWNPLATTKQMPGSNTFNGAGVQNYPSLGVGLDATRLTLYGGASSYGYRAIVAALRSCSSPDRTARAIQASAWCRGCAGGEYVMNKVPEVAADFELYASF